MNVAQDYTREQLADISAQFETAHPADVLHWAIETYGDRVAVVTSFQITGIVTLHMLQAIGARLPVITLDTGLLFPETETLIEQLTERFDLNLIRLTPEQTVAQQAESHGAALWQRNPDQCCHLRKTIPLQNELAKYPAWVAGLRRDQSPTRRNTPIIGWDARHNMVKLAPFATWDESMLWAYIRAYDLPYNSLHDQGYPSIGCWPCTRAVTGGDDTRAGRWSTTDKTECGIHVQTGASL